MNCLFHKWSTWTMYEETCMHLEYTLRQRLTETRQIRHCMCCGYAQDRLVKQGPMPNSSNLANMSVAIIKENKS